MPQPIRVLHVITRMVKGGAQENTLATVLGVGGAGWESSLATGPALGPEGSLEPECMAAGVRLLRVPELVREVSPAQDFTALRRLTALFRKERPQVVHTHTSKAGILGRVAARRAKVPVVVHTPHGHVFHSYEGGLKTRLFVHAERACAGMADRLVALTENERREHLELGVGAPEDWVTVHSGVDFAPFEAARGTGAGVRAELAIPQDAVVIGTVGRLVPIKGQSVLIDAFARLAAQYSGLHLLLVGDGELHGELVSQARTCGLRVADRCSGTLREHGPGVGEARGTVHFAGLRRDVPRYMAAMDVFTLPSLNEGMGRVLLEAMAMELPCVASRVSGIPDVVDDGVTGTLVPVRDPAALAAAVGALVAAPERARMLGRAGRRKAVPDWGARRMVEKLEGLYCELLSAKGLLRAAGSGGNG